MPATLPWLSDDTMIEPNSPSPTSVEVTVPSTSDNVGGSWFGDEQPNVLWRRHVIAAGAQVREFTTQRDLHLTLLYEPEPTLLAVGLPFHGTGHSVSAAEGDLLTAMEELLRSLSEAPNALSPYLLSVLATLKEFLEPV